MSISENRRFRQTILDNTTHCQKYLPCTTTWVGLFQSTHDTITSSNIERSRVDIGQLLFGNPTQTNTVVGFVRLIITSPIYIKVWCSLQKHAEWFNDDFIAYVYALAVAG
jgi:hypothetical protein